MFLGKWLDSIFGSYVNKLLRDNISKFPRRVEGILYIITECTCVVSILRIPIRVSDSSFLSSTFRLAYKSLNEFFSYKTFPAETFAPKVQMERNVEPKRLPRNVEMERRRRLYRNLKIEDLLADEGISSEDILPPAAILPMLAREEIYGLFSTTRILPLEIFDDEEYDCRYASESKLVLCASNHFWSRGLSYTWCL